MTYNSDSAYQGAESIPAPEIPEEVPVSPPAPLPVVSSEELPGGGQIVEECVPVPEQETHAQLDDFADVTSLSPADEEELFGLDNNEGDDPTGQDDDFSDILTLSLEDKEELFGTKPLPPRKKCIRVKRYIPPAGGVGGVQY